MFSTFIQAILPVIALASLMWSGSAQAFTSTQAARPNIPRTTTGAGVQQIAPGIDYTCVLTAGGGVKCFGGNRFIPKDVLGLTSNVRAISAGADQSCAVMNSGKVQCWGKDPGNVPREMAGLSNIQAVSIGGYHACALTVDGEVQCWGQNSSGQLGDGTTNSSSSPVTVPGLQQVQMVSAGLRHTCALTANGGVKCWGDNSKGQLGDESTTSSSSPVDVAGLASGVRAVSAGVFHTCALMNDNTVQCWGDNAYGQLGDGSTTASSHPVSVTGLSGVREIDTHLAYHACALTDAGVIKCWGANRFGQLGDGATENRKSPVDVTGLPAAVQAVATGANHACALTAEGDVMCWGSNYFGQGGKNPGWAPVQVQGLETGVQSIDIDWDHACAIVAGGVKCWGNNGAGQLGDGTRTSRSKPTDVTGLTAGVSSISIGLRFTCALTDAGEVKCWGMNADIDSLVPVDAPGALDHIKGLAVGANHACVITQNNGVKCWGRNSAGQLGDGSTTYRHQPVDVVGLTSGVRAISAGGWHTCALMMDGGVKCWGDNGSGQLGDGTVVDRTTPVDVVGLPPIRAISVGGAHTCAVTSGDGELLCWGGNHFGQLGDGSGQDSTTPVTVGGMKQGVQAVAAGASHTCAITRFGRAQCWGDNSNSGQLGNGSTYGRFVPDDVIWLQPDSVAISAGLNNSCVVSSQGEAKCWGDDSYGKLGDDGALWQNVSAPGPVQGDLSDSALLFFPFQAAAP